jgi:Protein of unknown function (DUF1524)
MTIGARKHRFDGLGAGVAKEVISKSYLARYYLRALDKTMKGDPNPEFVANDDYDAANLEHIIPLKPSSGWNISEEDAASASQMIGNLTLISSKKNVTLGNDQFPTKLAVYKESEYWITNQLEKFSGGFGLAEVKERQAQLSVLAIKTWSQSFAD